MKAIKLLAIFTLEVFRPPKKQTVSEWADQNRILATEGSAEPGRWRTSRAPYQREIMDSFTQPGVWQIVVMASAQTGKSECINNMLGYVIDNDPGPILYIQPTDATAEDYSKRRIAPMIEKCPTLKRKVYKARSRDAANTITMKTFPGGSLAIIGANSPSDLASKPVRYVFMDETDRFPASAGTEGDPKELAERRTETFRANRKIVKTSTPTIKGKNGIESSYMDGTQEEWHTECPECKQFSFIRFGNIKFDKEEFKNSDGDPDFNVSNVRWQCPYCKHETPEHMTKRLPGKWVANNPNAIDRGIRSFRLNAFMSPWSDWKEICRKFLVANARKDVEALKVIFNTMFGESWEIRGGDGLDETLYARREHYDAEVPAEVLILTMGMDTQDNRLEYEVVGWDRNGQSWGISRGVIPGKPDSKEVWEEVDYLLDREWQHASGIKMRILATFIDSGGHYTTAIYKGCERRTAKRIFPIKGEAGEGKEECRPMRKNQGEGAKFMLGVDAGKEGIMYEAGIQDPGPRYMHFPVEQKAGYDREYFKGLISEKMEIHRKNGAAKIVWNQIYERNEPLDCRNYARAAYRYFHWHFDEVERMVKGLPEEKPIVTQKEIARKKNRHVISRGITV